VGGANSAESGDGFDDNTPGGSVNVSQGGAQDIAQFRAIVEAGNVPTPDTLDPVGFFAEHAIDLPDADCGKDVCLHPLLAVAPRFNGGNWTMAFVAMNTAVDPSELERPPVHIAITIEKSNFTGIPETSLDIGLESLFSHLRPEDRVSVITFDEKAQRHVHLAQPGSQELEDLIYDVTLTQDGFGTDVGLYEGIAAAAKAFDEGDMAGFEGAHRVLLLTSGAANAGITDPDHILGLGEALVEEGTAFGVIGVGEKFDNKIPAALGSMGAGTYAYALSPGDLADLLTEEGKTTLFPLATEFDLNVLPSKGYKVGRIYGTKRATATSAGATLSMPALFIGQRDGATDVGGSRRGGGGGLFVELLPDPSTIAGVGADAPAFQVTAEWNSASGGLPQSVESTLLNSLPPGKNPDGMWWTISDGGGGKPFMMLNMYLALKAVLDFYQAGDCARALGVVEMMQPPLSAWLGDYPDSDITDDNNLMLKLRNNVNDACMQSQSSVEPVEPQPPQDFDGGCSSY
jgi:Ca-activated chloride channel family protein